MYCYKSLNNISDEEIVSCLNLAFSDYPLPIQMTVKQLQSLFAASGVEKELSYGAFSDGKMVGFILNSCGIYNNQKAVFDAGTGVTPDHRGNKVFTNLFAFAENDLRKHNIEKYYLETLQQNKKAILAYQKQGFTVSREFYVLKSSSSIPQEDYGNVKYCDMEQFDFNCANHCNYVQPSYEHSTNILQRNPALYGVAYSEKDKTTAFCIFAKDNGRIVQLGYEDIDELKIIIQALLTNFGNIIVKNIDKKYSQVLEMFSSIGFVEVTKQFEMVKDLKI